MSELSWFDELILLKTELRTSDFQHFHWLAGHRLSVHIPAVPNKLWGALAIKRAENIFAALRKNGQQKLFWTRID